MCHAGTLETNRQTIGLDLSIFYRFKEEIRGVGRFRLAESLLELFKLRSPCFYDVLWAMKGALSAATGIGLTRRIHLKNIVGTRLCTIILLGGAKRVFQENFH